MSKEIQEARRKLFESIYSPKGYTFDDDGLYSGEWASFYNAKWQGFNAALDAVEIQLPELAEGFADHVNEHAQTVFLDAIEQTGLGLKIK